MASIAAAVEGLRKVIADGIPKPRSSAVLTGTVVISDGKRYVTLDGSDQMTPVKSGVEVVDGERVTVEIRDHRARVTENLSSPAARTASLKAVEGKLDDVIADHVTAKQLEAERGRISSLETTDAEVKRLLTAAQADVEEIRAGRLTADDLEAKKGRIGSLDATTLTTESAKATLAVIDKLEAAQADVTSIKGTYVTAEQLKASRAEIDGLLAKKADVETLEAGYAHLTDGVIDNARIKQADVEGLSASYAHVADGVIDNAQIDQAKVRGLSAGYAAIDFANVDVAAIAREFVDRLLVRGSFVAQDGTVYSLTGLHLNAGDVTAGTMSVDRLAVRGEDGEYYVLSPNGDGTFAQAKLEGSILAKDSVNADRITANSITTEQITTNDLVGTGGWINLARGTFAYVDAETGHGISWDGKNLSISLDSLTIGGSAAATKAELDAAKAAAVVSTREEYALSASRSQAPDASAAWSGTPPAGQGCVWRRTVTTTGDGTETTSAPAPLTGEDGVVIEIMADRGTTFRDARGQTTLRASIAWGPERIEGLGELRLAFGANAAIAWEELPYGAAEWSAIGADDARLSEDGFALTASARDVDTQTSFRCSLLTE